MDILATIASVGLLAMLVWQILGSVINIGAIVLGLFKDEQ